MGKNSKMQPNINEATTALYRNSNVVSLYKSSLHNIALARFEWTNLPPEIDPRYLELALNEYGNVAFFYDKELDQYITLPCAIEGNYDIYMNPIKFRAFSCNGVHYSLTNKDAVVVFNDMLKLPTFPWLNYYAEQLYDVDLTRRINLIAQKTPVVFKGTDKQKLTMKNIWLKYQGNEPFFIVDESANDIKFEVFKTDAPYLGEDLTNMRRHMMGEIMIYLGYQTQEATQKAERLLKGELESAISEAATFRYSPLEMRRNACRQINNMFGLNIEVNFRQPVSSIVDINDPLMQQFITNPDVVVGGANK